MNTALRILAVLLVCATARAEDLLVLEHSPADHAASERLAELHDEPLEVLPETDALAQGRALGAARVVVFDGAIVRLIDTASGEEVTRSTPDQTPYTAAFVAAELLTLRPAPPPRLRFGLRLGPQLWLSAPFPAAARVELGIALVHTRWRAELHGAAPGRSSHADVARSRSDLGLRAGLTLLRHGSLSLLATAQLGAGWVRARIDEPGLPARTRTVFGAGIGLEPGLALTPWLSLYGSATLQLSTGRAEYRFAGAERARESPLGLSFGLGLWLTPPFR